MGVGAAIVAGGAGIALLNPPVRAEGEADVGAAGPAPRREWLGAGMIAVLVMAFGTTTLLSGVDLAIVAALEEAGQVSWAAAVVAVFGLASVAGGLVYGVLPRPAPTWLLLGLLGLVTIPAGLATDWSLLCLAVVGAGLLAAPTLSSVADAVSRLAPAAVRGRRPACSPRRRAPASRSDPRSSGWPSTCPCPRAVSRRPGWPASPRR